MAGCQNWVCKCSNKSVLDDLLEHDQAISIHGKLLLGSHLAERLDSRLFLIHLIMMRLPIDACVSARVVEGLAL
jgi:hypothetical protein